MTLRQFLAVLSSNKGVTVTLLDSEDIELLTFNVEGYQAVEGDVLERTVKKAVLGKAGMPNSIAIKVTLNPATDVTTNG